MKHSILLLLLFTLTAFFQTNGQSTGDQLIGKKMTFQGSLFQNGEPFDGTAKLKFTIALDSSSWTESHELVTVINGLYSVVLGQFTSLPNSLFYYTDERTVRVEVDNTVLGNVKLYAPFASRSASDNKIELFDQKGLVKAEMSVWSGQGFLNVDGPDDRSNAILSGNYYDAFGEMGDSSALNHGIMALFGPASGSGEPDHLRLLAGSRGDGSANDATPFLEMKAVDQTSGELKNMANLLVTNSRDSTNASTFKRGQLNLSDTRGRTSNLRSDQLYFFNPLNTQYPAGWYGTIGGSGFTQQVGYDGEGTITGAVLTGFWNRDHPGIWIEDKDANMGVFLSTEGGAGMLQLNGPAWNPNIQMGPKHWENSSLPFFVMRGESTEAFVNDNGTPDDASDDTNDNRHPDLIWMDVQKWDDGTEVGNLTLRGTDGSEFDINSHGINLNRLDMKDSLERTGLSLAGRSGGGGRLFFPSVHDDFTYNWIQNRVNEDGSASGSSQVANIASDGSYITGTGMFGGFFYIDSWANDQFYTNVELGLTQNDPKLPYMHLRGSEIIDWTDDNETPDDTSDDTSGSYLPNLLDLEVQKWDDGTEVGNLTLRGSDGSEFRLNSHGIDASQLNMESKTFKLQHLNSDQVIADLTSYGDGGQLNIKGLNNIGDTASSIGGGVSLGGKFWEGSPQLGYFHLRGTVNEANYFNANLKFTLEAMADGNGNENAEFRMYSPELDDASTAKSVLRMSSVTGDNQHWTSEIMGEGSFSPNFTLGAKTWEVDNDGSELPFFKMNGSFQTSYIDNNGTPEDSSDDFEGSNFKDLVWMSVDRWDDGSEIGNLTLRDTNGKDLHFNAHGIFTEKANFDFFNGNIDMTGHLSLKATRVQETDDQNNTYFHGLANLEVHEWQNPDGSDLDMGAVQLHGTDGSNLFITAHGLSAKKATIDFKNGFVGLNAHRFTQDDGNGAYYPVLAELNLDEWGDNPDTGEIEPDKDVARLTLRSSDGAEFGINAYGFIGVVENIDVSSVIHAGDYPGGSGALLNASGNIFASGQVLANSFDSPGVLLRSDWGTDGQGAIQLKDPSAQSWIDIAIYDDGNGNYFGGQYFGNSTDGRRVNIEGEGSIRINNGVDDIISLDSNGGINALNLYVENISASGLISADTITANVITQTSDARFKKNVKSIDNALAKTNALNGYTYYWNELADKKKGITSKDEQVGVLAQELEAVFPQLVSTDKEGYKSVNYSALSAVLIEAVKELNAEVKALKAENVVLKAEVGKSSELESRLAQIEKLLGVAAGDGSNANNK
jgi:hypothetical protein